MEAKRKSGLGQDVSASKKDLAQVQDSKQPEQPKKGVALGVDIGTQFCFAGCVDENKNFISLLPPSGEVAEYGIPTVMAVDSEEIINTGVNSETVTSGQTAIDNLKDNTSFRYREVSPSLKTLMRNGEDEFKVLSSNASYPVKIKQLAAIFIQDLLRILKYGNIKDAVINKIVVTYPNAASDGHEYMIGIGEAIGKAVIELLKLDSRFEYKDKFAQDFAQNIAQDIAQGIYNHIVVVSEAEVAARALQDKVTGPFATIDVGGGTIDIAYTGNKASPHSDDTWAIQKELDTMLKKEGINSSPFILANFKRKCFAQNWNIELGLGKCENCSEGNCNNKIDENGVSGICKTITTICDMQTNKEINNSFAAIIREEIEKAIDIEKELKSVVLLGGGSHMIFIQDTLKNVLNELFGEQSGITLYTITKTNGKDYTAIYQDNDKITTANFLAYAAALYGESSEEEKERSSMLFTPIASYRPLVSSPPFTYVLAANHPEDNETIYYMMPKNFSNGDIYYLYPGLWNLKCAADFSKGVLCVVKRNSGDIQHEQVIINEISLDATRQDDDHIDKEVVFVGPKQIEPGFYAVGVRYIGTMEEASDANRLQLYLYKSQGEVDGTPCDPKSDATPYIAEEDRHALSASYKTDLKFYDFRKAAIKCEKSPT